jgi:hypothetical protein
MGMFAQVICEDDVDGAVIDVASILEPFIDLSEQILVDC